MATFSTIESLQGYLGAPPFPASPGLLQPYLRTLENAGLSTSGLGLGSS